MIRKYARMRNKGKRFLVCCMALGLLFSASNFNNVQAAYVAPDSYNTVVNGNSGGSRLEAEGTLGSYHFLNNYNVNTTDDASNAVKGGALHLNAQIVNMGFMNMSSNMLTNSLFENNTGDYGGGLYLEPADTSMLRNVRFVSNNALIHGGGLKISDANMALSPMFQISDSLFERNHAGAYGGGIHIGGNAYMINIINTSFIGNTAGQSGGAVYVNLYDSNGKVRFTSNSGEEIVFRGNMEGVNDEFRTPESNAIHIANGNVELKTMSNSESKITFDDSISGTVIDHTDSQGNLASKEYKGNLHIISDKGGEITLNNQIKNLNLVHKSGTLRLNTSDKLADGASILQNVNLTFSPDGNDSIRFDLANGKLDNLLINNLSITEPTGDQKLLIALDVDLNQGLSDFFEVKGGSTGTLKFDTDHFELNIIDDGNADKFQLIGGVPDSFLTGELVQFSENGKYKFTVGEGGFINVTREDTSGLPEAVASDEAIREYVALKNIKLTQSLGAMGGESLTINMKDFALDGNKNQGITLASNQRLTIKNANGANGGLSNFYTDGNGAAVNNIGGAVTITDSVVSNNVSDGKGGAIYALGGAVTINADTKDVVFRNNIHEAAAQPIDPDAPIVTKAAAGSKNDIYLENAADGTKATLAVNGSKNTIIESGIAGNGEITKNDAGIMKLGGDNSKFTGDVYLNGGEVQLLSGASYFNAQNTFVKNNSRINLANNNPNDVVNFGNLDLDGNAKLGIDLDGKNNLSDKIGAISVTGDGKILIDNINVMSYGSGKSTFDIITLDEATKDSPLLGLVELSPEAKKVMSPIFKYQADFDSNTGVMSLVSGSRGDKNSYNPSILATPVALQTAAQAGIKEAVNYAFEHNDAFTKLPYNERFAQLNSNKYAISEFNGQMPLYNGQAEGNAVWFRPYTVFEEIDLSHGPKVDNLSYGSLIGFDAKFKERKHGWTSISSGFLGYHGSSLDYGDIDIMSNGALLGLTKNYYRKNFWTALTMAGNIGLGKVSEMYGDDDIVHLSGAVSSKTGYNIEMADGKFIIQPNIGLSYYISKIFDYTNEAGVRINSDPLNSFEIKPGVRLVGNTKGGWQPYLSAAMVWNAFDKTDVRADGIKLPGMNMDPYVEYGLGFQRIVNNDFTCYLQSLVRNGGRTGVALTGGMSWAIGADDTHKYRIHL